MCALEILYIVPHSCLNFMAVIQKESLPTARMRARHAPDWKSALLHVSAHNFLRTTNKARTIIIIGSDIISSLTQEQTLIVCCQSLEQIYIENKETSYTSIGHVVTGVTRITVAIIIVFRRRTSPRLFYLESLL